MTDNSTIPSTELASDSAPWHELLAAGRSHRAARLLTDALKTDPDNPDLWYQLAYACYRFKRKGRAKQAVLVAIKLADNQVDSYALLGRIYADQGLFQQAQYALDCGLALDAAHDDCLWQKAEVLCRQFALEEAERTLDRIDFYNEKDVLTKPTYAVARYGSEPLLDPLLREAFAANPFGTKTADESLETLVKTTASLRIMRATNLVLGLTMIGGVIGFFHALGYFLGKNGTYGDFILLLFGIGFFVLTAVRDNFLYQPWLLSRFKRPFLPQAAWRKSTLLYLLTIVAATLFHYWEQTGSGWLVTGYILTLLGAIALAWNLVPLAAKTHGIEEPNKRWRAKTQPSPLTAGA